MFPTWFEGFSGALLEGMATGLAVVATTAGSGADLLDDHRNALVIPRGDAPALVRAIRELAGDEGLRNRLGAAARERGARYCWDIVNVEYAEHLLAAYGRFTGGRRLAAADRMPHHVS